MARDLRINIEGNSTSGRKALDDVADESDKAAKQIDKLGEQFRQSARSGAQLERQLDKTRRELKDLNEEYAKGGDPKVLREIQKQYTELDRISKLKKRISKDDDDAQRLAAAAARAAFAESVKAAKASRGFFGRLIGRGTDAVTQAGAGVAGAAGKIPGGALAGGLLAASAAPAAGGAVGGALLGGAALGGVGLGVAGAIAGNPAPFQAAWTDAIQSISKRWQDASSGFERPALSAFATIKNAIDDINIEGPLKDAEKYVEPLARGLSSLVTGIGNGVGKLVSKAGPVVDVLAQRLPELGKAFELAFGRIGDSSDGAAQALSDVLKITRSVIVGVGGMIGFLSDVYSKSVDIRKNISGLVGVDLFGDQDSMLQTYARSLDGATGSTFNMVTAQNEMRDAARAASDELDRQVNLTLGLQGANDNATIALKNLKKGFEENGVALQGNSDQALENRDNLRQVIAAYEDVRTKAIEAGDGSKASIDKANQAYLQQLEDLRANLRAIGANTTALDEYIAKVKELDGQHPTVVIRVRYDVASRPAGLPANLGTRYGGTDMYADGGDVRNTGFATVGERGMETVFLNRGEYVATAEQTKRLVSQMSGGSGSGTGGRAAMAVTVTFAGNTDQAFASSFQNLVRTGQIQIAANAA